MVKLCCPSTTSTRLFLVLFLQFIILCALIEYDTNLVNETILSVKAMYVRAIDAEIKLREQPKQSLSSALHEAVEERVQLVRQNCNRRSGTIISNYPKYDAQSMTKWIWMASPRHHLFYCATPKCGSTTWKSYLMEDLAIKWKTDTHVAATTILGIYPIYIKSHLRPIAFLKSYRPKHRLMIVRSPWARLLSAYEDKIIDKKWKLKALCAGWRRYSEVENVTFEQFIDCILEKPLQLLYEAHTHPLTSLCSLCHMDYNIILKVEELDQAEPYLMERLNFTIKPKYRPSRKLKYNTYSQRYRNISVAQIYQLQKVYKYDLELFDYPITPFD